MNIKNFGRLILLGALTLSACGTATLAPSAEPTAGPDLALTVTSQAQIFKALTQTALVPPTSTFTPEPAVTLPPLPTDAPSKVIITVRETTNCRSGPSGAYDIVGALAAGLQAEATGRNSALNYWIIKNPNKAGTCWLWGEHAIIISGDAARLEEFAAPPTVTAAPVIAAAPVIDRVTVRFDASSGAMIVYLEVFFRDGEGDANLANFQIVSASRAVTGGIKDVSFAPSANQRNGASVTGQWGCGSKQYDMAVVVTVRDQAGHTSNSYGVNFSCNKN